MSPVYSQDGEGLLGDRPMDNNLRRCLLSSQGTIHLHHGRDAVHSMDRELAVLVIEICVSK